MMDNMTYITPLYAGIFGIALVVLSRRVANMRKSQESGLMRGDAHNDLTAAVRAQANIVEYLPMALLLMWMMEMIGYASWLIHLLGIFLVAARALHLHGLNEPGANGPTRKLGTRMTWLHIVLCGLACIAGTFGFVV